MSKCEYINAVFFPCEKLKKIAPYKVTNINKGEKANYLLGEEILFCPFCGARFDIFDNDYLNKSKVNKKEEIPIVSMQMLLDSGINAFALQLLLKSIVDKKDCKTFSPLSFIFQGIKITFEPVKE